MPPSVPTTDASAQPVTIPTRRRFLAYLVAAPTLAVGVRYGLLPAPALAAIPGSPEPADILDLGELLILGAKPFENMQIQLVLGEDGVVSCALPRMEVGQGLTTAIAMLIADELDLPLDKVRMSLAPARPELMTAQLTGSSNSIRSLYEPVRTAAASMRGTLVAAARQQGLTGTLRTTEGSVLGSGGQSKPYASLAKIASNPALFRRTQPRATTGKLVGTPTDRIDARGMVTGELKYTNDLEPVAGALRAMVTRPPTIRGRVGRIKNEAAVRALPGIIDLKVIDLGLGGRGGDAEVARSTGVAVIAETFGQALDGKETLDIEWLAGPIDANENDDSVRATLKAAQQPFITPALPGGTVEAEFFWHFASHAPLEGNTAIADVRKDGADIWTGTKSPVVAQSTIESELGVPTKVHVIQAGGSFGRRLFFDGGQEAARISQAIAKPVKLMYTRIDDMRHGRARPAMLNNIRMTYAGDDVLSMEQRVTSVDTDLRHGLGDAITSAGGAQLNLPPDALPVSLGGNASFTQTLFATTVFSPYSFGATSQTLTEVPLLFNTASWRSVYSAPARGCEEILVDEMAAAMGKDPAAFRLEFLPDARQRAVVQKVMDLGEWGRPMPANRAQGIGYHEEYKSMTACLVELDVSDRGRPRVTRATIACDVGLPINPRGLEAQLQGGLNDAIATVFRAGLHLRDGLFLEGSYSQFHFPRQQDGPTRLDVFIFPETTGEPGGAGELGVPAAVGALGNAWARATGEKPRTFPLIFPIDFEPFPVGPGTTRRKDLP